MKGVLLSWEEVLDGFKADEVERGNEPGRYRPFCAASEVRSRVTRSASSLSTCRTAGRRARWPHPHTLQLPVRTLYNVSPRPESWTASDSSRDLRSVPLLQKSRPDHPRLTRASSSMEDRGGEGTVTGVRGFSLGFCLFVVPKSNPKTPFWIKIVPRACFNVFHLGMIRVRTTAKPYTFSRGTCLQARCALSTPFDRKLVNAASKPTWPVETFVLSQGSSDAGDPSSSRPWQAEPNLEPQDHFI
eukprot:1267607-Rhodomonas_salina.2